VILHAAAAFFRHFLAQIGRGHQCVDGGSEVTGVGDCLRFLAISC
jgi:hypothetical protein